jgi:hypothetical protein
MVGKRAAMVAVLLCAYGAGAAYAFAGAPCIHPLAVANGFPSGGRVAAPRPPCAWSPLQKAPRSKAQQGLLSMTAGRQGSTVPRVDIGEVRVAVLGGGTTRE